MIQGQVDREIAKLKAIAAKWTGTAMTDSLKRGRSVADQQIDAIGETQARQAGIRSANQPLKGSFAQVDRRTVEILAKDTVTDLANAADSMRRQASDTLRRMAATGVTNAEVNKILTGGVIEGKPVEAIRELRDALKKVHGEVVTIETKNGEMQFEAGYYAKMVATTKTREATCKARHARLKDRGIDLVVITGKISDNFCTAYMDKVFSISGASDKYPPLSSLPGGGPPFHPNCSKGTAPFIEELADPEEIAAGLPDDQTENMLNVKDRNVLQRTYQDQKMMTAARQRAATLRTDAGPKLNIQPNEDVSYYEHLAREFGVEKVHLGRDPEIAGNIVQGLQQVVSAGGEQPKNLVVDRSQFVDANGNIDLSWIGFFEPSTNSIFFNPDWPGWKNIKQTMADRYQKKFFSSSSPFHQVYHEAAHAHFDKLGSTHRNQKLGSQNDEQIAKAVSNRAMENKDEFLAEVRSGMMAGRRFGKEVKTLYERLGGR